MKAEKLKQRVSAAIASRDFALAEKLCRQAERSVHASELLLIRGAVFSVQGKTEQALTILRQAYEALPARADVAYNYGVALQQSGNMAEAVRAWERSVAVNPQNAGAWLNLALGTAQLGEQSATLDVYRRAIGHHPANRDLLYNHANLLFRADDLPESEAAFRALLKHHPRDAAGWTNLGMVLKSLRRFEEAERAYRRAIEVDGSTNPARAHFNLAVLLLLQGRWREGFAAYDWRLKLPNAIGSPWPLPKWDNTLPKGSRVLLWNDQGQGDAILFLRFASLLADQGYRPFAFVQNSLKELAATVPSIEAAYSPQDERQPMDAQLPLCSLPFALDLETVDVWSRPYLRAPEQSAFAFDETTKLRVGLVWAGNEAIRSMRFADFDPLFELPGIDWFGLQFGGAKSELEASPHRNVVRDLSPHLAGFANTASVVAKLDLLISIDTAVGHVAGALGKPVWTVLTEGSDWRWGTEGDKTIWYPSMRLFRQTQKDRAPMIAEVAAGLRAMSRQRPA